MRFAEKEGKRILPTPLKNGVVCPYCKEEVIAKCGKINQWHWAHKSINKCDSWFEEESRWHLDWKKKFPEDFQEVIIQKIDKKHIADIRCKNGMVIELQNSSISSEKIGERERFYEEMVWVLNPLKFAENLCLRKKDKFYTFRWKWFPRSWASSEKPIYIDYDELAKKYLRKMELAEYREDTFTDEMIEGGYVSKLVRGKDYYYQLCMSFRNKLFLIKKIYINKYVGGWGQMIDKTKFIEEYSQYK